MNQEQGELKQVGPKRLRWVIASIIVLALPPIIWMFLTQHFYPQAFIESVGLMFQFSAYRVAWTLPFGIPAQSDTRLITFLLNLLAFTLISAPICLILTRTRKMSTTRAVWIAVVSGVFVLELMGMVDMFMFASTAGP